MFTQPSIAKLRLFVWLGLCLALVILDHKTSYLHTVRHRLSEVVFPMEQMMTRPFEWLQGIKRYSTAQRQLLFQLQDLRSQKSFLEARLQNLQALEAENRELRLSLNASERVSAPIILADIVDLNISAAHHEMLIRHDHNSLLHEGQAVIDDKGVLGQITEVFPTYARVLLILDASHAVPIFNERTLQRGIACGRGERDVVLDHVIDTADFKVGDRIITSGIGGRFPYGYPVGEVERIDHQMGDDFMEVHIRPYGNFQAGRFVMVVAS